MGFRFNLVRNTELIMGGMWQRTAIEQTKAVFAHLRQRIEDAVTRLEEQIAIGEENGAPEGELEAARGTLQEGQQAPPAETGGSA